MNIDTEIQHVTNPSANLFLELGFEPDEAERFYAESQQRIKDERGSAATLLNRIRDNPMPENCRRSESEIDLQIEQERIAWE